MDKNNVQETYHKELVPGQIESGDEKHDGVSEDTRLEHNLTLRQVLKHHKPLAAWTFFWALCAIGWYVTHRPTRRLSMLTCLSRGFDAQVNGAMIAVPAFRRDFG